ncbi:MAG: DUF1801 domain-containing protein [Thermoanaerobaculia bacterium]
MSTKKSFGKSGPERDSAAEKIGRRIDELADWRGEMLARLRELILAADPEVEEEWKWAMPKSPGIPVWSHSGILCTGETYKQVVKLTFARGASVPDPKGLFNSSLEGKVRRAIDFREGEKVDATGFAQLVRAAVATNLAVQSSKKTTKKAAKKK